MDLHFKFTVNVHKLKSKDSSYLAKKLIILRKKII